MSRQKYVIFGAGGTGGGTAAIMARGGLDVTVIARGKNLEAIRTNGLKLYHPEGDFTVPVRAMREEDYADCPDVILVCVKGYSVEEIYPFLRRVADAHTRIIPILNIFGTGEAMQLQLPGLEVLNGCIYISAFVKAPGEIFMTDTIHRIVFGRVDGAKGDPILDAFAEDLRACGIMPIYSEDVRRDTLQKYCMVSPFAAVGSYLDVPCGAFQREGRARSMYVACIRELLALAEAMEIHFTRDVEKANVAIADSMAADATSSLYKDIKKGGNSEIDGLIFEPVRLGRRYGVPTPTYSEIAAHFGFEA